MIKKYRPSNGTEGEFFMNYYCDRCKHDSAYRNGTGYSCEIVSDAITLDIDDENYPTEWQYKDGEPVCTKFEMEAK